MFRTREVRKSLAKVVGFRQNEGNEFAIDGTLLTTETGKVYQQAHPLLTLNNIRAVAPKFDDIKYDAYNAENQYAVGNKVIYNSKLYKAINLVPINVAPGDEQHNNYWVTFDQFSEWLTNKVADSNLKMINRFLDEKMAYGQSKSLIENKMLFDGAGRIYDVDTTSSGIVGFEIIPARSRSVTVRIDKLGIQFYADPNVVQNMIVPFKFWLYHSSSHKPIKTYIRNITVGDYAEGYNGKLVWLTDVNIVLPYHSILADAGGSWFICYNIDELPVGIKPVIKQKDWSHDSCNSCDQNAIGLNTLSKYAEVHPFKVNAPSDELWDIADNIYTQFTNYGLNLEISVVCDFTDFIMTQRRMFANTMLLQFAVDMLKEMCYNPNVRINRNALMAQRSELIFALEGDTSGFRKSGLMYELDLSYRALSADTSGIDKICLPNKNGGIKYRTV